MFDINIKMYQLVLSDPIQMSKLMHYFLRAMQFSWIWSIKSLKSSWLTQRYFIFVNMLCLRHRATDLEFSNLISTFFKSMSLLDWMFFNFVMYLWRGVSDFLNTLRWLKIDDWIWCYLELKKSKRRSRQSSAKSNSLLD